MRWYYKVFWVMFFIEVGVTPFLLIQYYLTGVNLVAFYKVPLLISFATIFYFHLVNRFKWRPINLLFLIGGTFSLIFGIYHNYQSIDLKLLPAIYTFFMPIFAVSFGVYFAQEYNERALAFVKRYMNLSLVLTLVVLIVYLFFYYAGQIPYYGFATKIDFIGTYSITTGGLPQYLICLVFAVLSGKRATTLMTFLVLLIFYSSVFTKVTVKKVLYIIPLIVLLGFGFVYAKNNDVLRRFEVVFEFDISDRRSTYLATGGRWQEVEGILEFFKKEPYKWYTGAGMGAKFSVYDFATDSYWRKHYSHITPLGYTFLYGVIFTVLLYLFIFSLILRGRHKFQNFYFLAFIIMIAGSSFGANLFADHKIWVFVGIAYVLSKDKNNLLPISYLHLKNAT